MSFFELPKCDECGRSGAFLHVTRYKRDLTSTEHKFCSADCAEAWQPQPQPPKAARLDGDLDRFTAAAEGVAR